ncbi:MAG TPA: class I SAM-dependent methyltransferase [Solibacterales bacterium]|nr:class I SAM-dependent methyltransferase [Bryobacterales bacterium]
MTPLEEAFGQIDIYLFDQVLRGRIPAGATVLDAGCGGGRNLVYFLRNGYRVFGVDEDEAAVEGVRRLAGALAPELPAEHFRWERVEAMSFPEGMADVVLSSAVLHFARDEEHFEAMLRGSWRVLRPGGVFFCRLASSIGMEARVRPLGRGRYGLPDGSERYLVTAEALARWERALGARRLDPLKTTVVEDQRSMTTWVLTKGV